MNKSEKPGKYNKELGLWENPDGTVNVTSSNIPIPLWINWDEHCKVRHNNCRWEKMVSDHEKARAYEYMQENYDKMLEMFMESKGISMKKDGNKEEVQEEMKQEGLFR